MRTEADALDLTILYGAARGFLEIRDRDAQIRYALLSMVGATGAGAALWLERDGERLELREARGSTDHTRPLSITRKLETALREARDPVVGSAIRKLGAAPAKWAERSQVEMIVPLLEDGGHLAGLFALGPRMFGDPYSEREVSLAAEIADLAALARASEIDLRRSRHRRPAARRIARIREKHPAFAEFQGEGPATARLFEELVGLSEFDLPVLILGETGTGKELVARAIHELSGHRTGSFEAINCAAIPRDLMASTLFGHERGAFTGAVSTVRGAFERAGQGTIFLDEIGDMPAETQASLLRVLQEGTFRRVGGDAVLPAQARVVSATNRDLAQAVEGGTFRADLFYRLQMFAVRIPPLRERREEIPILAKHLLRRHAGSRRPVPSMSRELLDELCRAELPGNARELESLIVGALVRAGRASTLTPEHLPPLASAAGAPADPGSLVPRLDSAPAENVPSYESMERQYIRSVLKLTEGNKKEAAELMGIPRTTLNARMKKLGLDRSAD